MAAPSKDRQVTIYTTSTCPWCVRTKSYLAKKKVPFREVNVGKDRKGREEMLRLTHQGGVPVVRVGNDYVVGWNRSAIQDLLRTDSGAS